MSALATCAHAPQAECSSAGCGLKVGAEGEGAEAGCGRRCTGMGVRLELEWVWGWGWRGCGAGMAACESKGEMSEFMSMLARMRYLRHWMRRPTPASS